MRGRALGALAVVRLDERARRARRHFDSKTTKRNRRDDAVAFLVMASILRDGDVAIDIGASVGAFLERIVDLAPSGRHVAYEPIPRLAKRLRQRFPDVDVREAVLSDTAGTSRFFVNSRPWESSLFPLDRESVAEVVEVRAVRLDDDLPADVTPRFVKIDVEGAEALVFRGAQHTLSSHRPVVLFEHGEASRRNGISSAEVWALLVPLGYRIFDCEGREYDLRAFEQASAWNFFAVPTASTPG